MQGRVGFHAVPFHQVACRFVVAFAFDALYLAEQKAEQLAEPLIVADADVCFPVTFYKFGHSFFPAMPEGPPGDEGAVAHVGFFDVPSRFDAYHLGQQPVHHVAVILCLVGFGIGCQS